MRAALLPAVLLILSCPGFAARSTLLTSFGSSLPLQLCCTRLLQIADGFYTCKHACAIATLQCPCQLSWEALSSRISTAIAFHWYVFTSMCLQWGWQSNLRFSACRHKVQLHLFRPQSATTTQAFTGWLWGMQAEYADGAYPGCVEGRELTRTISAGQVNVEMTTMTKVTDIHQM